MKQITILVALSFLLMFQSASGEYERKRDSDDAILAHGESIIYSDFKAEEKEFTRVLEDLVELSTSNSPNGKGLSVIPIINPNQLKPSITIDTKTKNFFELLDIICILAGPDFTWGTSDKAVFVMLKGHPMKIKDPFEAKIPNQSEQDNPITRP
ncbi:hypothetical protein DDZ13_15170 [Coraliomargarita sinensis]|uniref:GerMN domain-containing protein n=1 Tax=Coraliomargarita sinensis TaxID=2174842 RepID=A0A317ZCH0_9BACT|nr:hypothetical protein [Coraliomargarita sinensis]PXA02816.1 hypothetical protein DDZ13_15170 [Coraliomargarita sinensis]